MQVHVYVVAIPLLLLLAAVFAASEASLFSLSRAQLETIKEQRPLLYARIKNLIFEPDALLSTIIIGNECLNILVGTFIASLLQTYWGEAEAHWLILSAVLLTSILLLTFSEILPKILAFRMPILLSSILVYPMGLAHNLLTPLRIIFLSVSRSIISRLGIQISPPAAVSEKDFLTLVEVGAESGSLDKEEKDMIFNVFHFGDMFVSQIMTPWNKVFAVKENDSVTAVIEGLKKNRFSRIPVLDAKEERVIGILYSKELLNLLLSEKTGDKEGALKDAMNPPYIVSAHKKVSAIFRDFRTKKVHIALVVNEYGKHLGILTLEDILNSLLHNKTKKEAS